MVEGEGLADGEAEDFGCGVEGVLVGDGSEVGGGGGDDAKGYR